MTQNIETDDKALGIAVLAILSGVFVASLSDAFIKLVSANIQLWQIFLLRSLLTIPALILVIKIRSPHASIFPREIAWTALRSLLLVFMWVALYAALPMVKLSVAGAAYYTLPLFITLFAAIFTGEKVGAKGWLAVVIGFSGVLLILRPNAADFNPYALLPLASAIFYAIAMILTRSKIRDESALVLSLSLNMAFAIVGALGSLFVAISIPTTPAANSFLLSDWVVLDLQGWLVIAILAILITTGSQLATIAYQLGPSSTVSSFDFCYLVFVVMWGAILFGEVPDAVTILGITLIASAGIMVIQKA
ncbi:DMT family transporter [Roseovarius sp. EL26]|uniref:DMT family transporter n=1 Tax=Roseovarius sp. EL26 TaxID=2126672 RepID=UPI000EA37007|nr:DMT family transporter [Roseovarius sp. EL26]